MLENVSRSLVLTDSAMTRILSVIDNNKDIGSKFSAVSITTLAKSIPTSLVALAVFLRKADIP